jgi:hypothetical protein
MNFKSDVMLSLRRLKKDLGFTGIAVAILALGIGVNSAIFSLVNVILLRPIAGVPAERIVGLFHKDETRPDSYRAFSYPDYLDIRSGNDSFEHVMAHNFAMVGLTEGETTRRVFSDTVSSNYFQTLGVRLHLGRAFSADEETPGRETPVAILGYGLWKKMGGDANILGSQIKVNARNLTVVGVAPDGFSGTMALAAPELWLPLSMYDATLNDFQKSEESQGTKLADRTHRNLILVGQLKEGATLESASAQAKLVGTRLAEAYPAENKDHTVTLAPLSRMSVSTNPQSDTPIAAANAILLALASVVLIVACFNLANMLLARGEARQKEIALRLALGSGTLARDPAALDRRLRAGHARRRLRPWHRLRPHPTAGVIVHRSRSARHRVSVDPRRPRAWGHLPVLSLRHRGIGARPGLEALAARRLPPAQGAGRRRRGDFERPRTFLAARSAQCPGGSADRPEPRAPRHWRPLRARVARRRRIGSRVPARFRPAFRTRSRPRRLRQRAFAAALRFGARPRAGHAGRRGGECRVHRALRRLFEFAPRAQGRRPGARRHGRRQRHQRPARHRRRELLQIARAHPAARPRVRYQ